MAAELLRYEIDPTNDNLSAVLRLESGAVTTHSMRCSHYLSEPYTTADVQKAVSASLEDHADITLAKQTGEIADALNTVKEQAEAARIALEAPAENADATIAELAASVQAHLEAAQRLANVHDALVRADAEAKAAQAQAEEQAARDKAIVEQAAEVERAKVARDAEDARIDALVTAKVAQAMAAQADPKEAV